MGIESEQFVHPERISSQLFCAICTQVLDNPVITETEHLFCENELLEWFVIKGDQVCPVTNQKLDATKIVKPGRVITNMLKELERYCVNKPDGCQWSGPSEHLTSHLKSCCHRPRQALDEKIDEQATRIGDLNMKLATCHSRIVELEEENLDLCQEVDQLKRRLKVYDAFFKDGHLPTWTTDEQAQKSNDAAESDYLRLMRLRGLSSLASIEVEQDAKALTTQDGKPYHK